MSFKCNHDNYYWDGLTGMHKYNVLPLGETKYHFRIRWERNERAEAVF